MSKIYNEEINKHTDWGGDESTGNLPVSGEQVQKFIKDTLNSKFGVFYYDESSNRYLVFADEESRDKYIDNPETNKDFLLGSFDAPFNYETKIDLIDTKTYNAVQKGSTGNIIKFTFNTYNKQQQPVGGLATVTYTIIRNSTKKVITETKNSGSTVTFNLDKYLDEGTNTIIISVTDRNTLSATTISIIYQVVDLSINDNFDISKPYTSDETMNVTVHVKGAGTKTIEWYIDGRKLDFVKDEDEVVSTEDDRTKYINLQSLGLGVGRHSLQIRAYSIVNSERFYTDILYRDFIIKREGYSDDPVIAIAINRPSWFGIVEGSIDIITVEQYIPYDIRIASYSLGGDTNGTKIKISIDDGSGTPEEKGTIISYNGVETIYTLMFDTAQGLDVILEAESETGVNNYILPIKVLETSMNIATITNGLEFALSAIGRSNSEENRDQWNYGNYIGTFKGFRWDDTSGWNNNRLVMPAGTSFSINYAPLSNEPVDTGKTIELEFSTSNVKDDDAVICDLRGPNGTGLLITASKVSITSEGGVTAETEFRSGENIRVSFVINKSKDVTNKGLTFIYTNGILSGAVARATTDSYISSKELSIKSTDRAEVVLKEIRIYNRALSSDDILNNYILYRDTIEEMTEIYNRNDVYEEGSTSTFSPDKMASRLPVMIITGEVDKLENTTDKNEQIEVSIEYTNLQDPTKSFKLENAAMRPQGTSSMYYPKKNFRIYSRRLDKTKLFDYRGKEVKDRLYSFKDNAQPVDCWCLKADYAESSGTHNTGLAKLWNDAFYNVKLTPIGGNSKEYVCRTNAQKAALEENYKYDVRTTIDGFPILLFYRGTAEDPLIFLGKYNFNNDKSTEAVFGFVGLSEEHPEGIPGFDDTNMQCWEVLNNGNDYTLFKTYKDFDTNWSEAYESRYPDTKSPDITALKNFTKWMVDVTEEDFKTQKWDHMDVYKMAAYYVYIIRHAAVDQTVKNAMFTTEDAQHFYYILYDNDTTHGLINTGVLKVKPTDDRQTVFTIVDNNPVYIFAGHDSKLWNMLEADTEFMGIVKEMDRALYTVGISYDNVIKVLDKEQADKWVERVYNQDAQYKYIGPYNNKGTNYLSLLQGKRDLHRKWWLAKRFAKYDAEFVSGDYVAKAISLKLNGLPAENFRDTFFSITAGYSTKYGYGVNNIPKVTNIDVPENESYTFGIPESSGIGVLNVGDPVNIYGAPNIKSLDLSEVAGYLNTLDITYLNDNLGNNSLTELILGGNNIENIQLGSISGLKVANKLERINIEGFKSEYFKTLDLSEHKHIKIVEAAHSGITSLILAKGSPVTKITLPGTITTLTLDQLPLISNSGLMFEDINTISRIDIKGCPLLSNDFTFIYEWFKDKITTDELCSLTMDNVQWDDVDINKLLNLTRLGALKLKGKIVLSRNTTITEGQMLALKAKFGDNVFSSNSELYIQAPLSVYFSGPTSITEGSSGTYSCVVIGAKLNSAKFNITSGSSSYITLVDNNDGTATLNTINGAGGSTITVQLVASTVNEEDNTIVNPDIIKTITTQIIAKTYPSSSNTTLSGDSQLGAENTYTIKHTATYTGDFNVEWTLTGFDDYAEIVEFSKTSCTIRRLQPAINVISGTLSVKFTKVYNGSTLFTLTKSLQLVNENIAVADAKIAKVFYDAGLCANSTYITKDEAALITADDIQPGTTASTSIFYKLTKYGTNFSGFKYFTSISTITQYFFGDHTNGFDVIELPDTVTKIDNGSEVFSSISLGNVTILSDYLTTIVGNITIGTFDWPRPDTPLLRISNNLSSIKIHFSGSNMGTFMIVDGNNLSSIAIGGNTPPWSGLIIKSANIRAVISDSPIGSKFVVGGDAGLPTTVTTPSGGYFEDMSTIQDAILEEINPNVYKITNKVYYATITINTNLTEQDPDFLVTYTNQNDEEVQTTVKAGTHILPIKYGTTVKVSGVTEIENYITPGETSWTYNYTSCSYTFTKNYVENIGVYIQHIDGTLYTTDDWTSGGYTNEEANGVAVVRPISGSFVIAKEESSSRLKWGGYGTNITDIVTSTSNSTAVLDNDGAGNTPKIIEQLTGVTDSYGTVGAPAAEYCASYTFPNGKTGYLGALGEWQAAYNNKAKVNSAMSLIGGTTISTNYYWSSTQHSSDGGWGLSWSSYYEDAHSKNGTYYVRAFCSLS